MRECWCDTFRRWAVDLQTRPSLPELDAARPWAHFSGARSWRDSDGVPSSSFLASSAWPAGSLVRLDLRPVARRLLFAKLLRVPERGLPGYSSLAAPSPVPRSLLFCCY